MGYSPWGRKESDMTEQLHIHFLISSLPCFLDNTLGSPSLLCPGRGLRRGFSMDQKSLCLHTGTPVIAASFQDGT